MRTEHRETEAGIDIYQYSCECGEILAYSIARSMLSAGELRCKVCYEKEYKRIRESSFVKKLATAIEELRARVKEEIGKSEIFGFEYHAGESRKSA